jgi:hypothetical protein
VPQAILLSDWLISRKYSPLKSIGDDFLEINQSEIRIACGAVFVNGLG